MLKIGIVGTGFAALIHLDTYKLLPGGDFCLYGICSKDAVLKEIADKYNIAHTFTEYADMLADPNIDVVDIITPPALHAPMIEQAMEAGKDVICEKPLTGYFGDAVKDGQDVSRLKMYEATLAAMDKIRACMQKTGKRLFYAENYVYTPAVQKCAELLRAKKSRILLLKGEESHSGSHAAHAPYWRINGGGALIRQGCHPLSAALYLKQVEAQARGESIHPVAVSSVCRALTAAHTQKDKKYTAAEPYDVEDYSIVMIEFSDGSIAQILASDNTLGGVRNNMEIYTNEGNYQCNIAPNNALMVYNEDADDLDDIYITEKLGQKAGWQSVFLEENLMRGYVGELTDFISCLATGAEPKSDFDLAYQSMQLIYAAYRSSSEGRRIEM